MTESMMMQSIAATDAHTSHLIIASAIVGFLVGSVLTGTWLAPLFGSSSKQQQSLSNSPVVSPIKSFDHSVETKRIRDEAATRKLRRFMAEHIYEDDASPHDVEPMVSDETWEDHWNDRMLHLASDLEHNFLCVKPDSAEAASLMGSIEWVGSLADAARSGPHTFLTGWLQHSLVCVVDTVVKFGRDETGLHDAGVLWHHLIPCSGLLCFDDHAPIAVSPSRTPNQTPNQTPSQSPQRRRSNVSNPMLSVNKDFSNVAAVLLMAIEPIKSDALREPLANMIKAFSCGEEIDEKRLGSIGRTTGSAACVPQSIIETIVAQTESLSRACTEGDVQIVGEIDLA